MKIQVTFKVQYAKGSIQENDVLPVFAASKIVDGVELITAVQCFPLYSILLSVGRTQVDFFSLDVVGHELRIPKTIP